MQGEEGAAKVKKSKKSKEKKRDRSAEKDAEAATEPAAVSGGSEKVRNGAACARGCVIPVC